jgi:uncharacterized protein (TIGR02001 family)
MLKIFRAGLMSGAALVAMSGAAFAADLGDRSLKDAPAATPDYTITVNGGFMTDYVFRGISQNDNDPSVFAGVDLAYKMFYVGVWGAAVDDVVSNGGTEIDVYGGIKHSVRGLDFDFGLIYYGYPSQGALQVFNSDYLELKAAVSTKILSDMTVTGSVFWSPDYAVETGSTWTIEGKVSKPLPLAGLVLSGALGYVTSDDDGYRFSDFYGDDSYTYWNIGLSRTFREHYTIDLRYSGTDVNKDAAADFVAGDRVMGTFTFNY